MPISSNSETVSMENLDERVPLVSEVASPFTLVQRHSRRHDAVQVDDVDGDELDLAFRAVGVDVFVRDVTLISPRTRDWPTRRTPTILCQSVAALWEHAQLHAVIATDKDAIEPLFLAVTRREACAAGDIRFNTLAEVTERCFGVVGRESVVVPGLTVAQNLEFAINLLTRARPEWKREMIAITSSFLALSRYRTARDLDASETFRLKLGMELIRDPSILFLVDPFVGMSDGNVTATVDLLHRVAQRLHKTVVVGAWTSPFYLLNASATAVLLGRGGRTLYSGPTRGVCHYFNQLHIRAALTQDTASPDNRVRTAEPATPLSRHAAAPTTSPYRLSSPLRLLDDGSPTVHAATPPRGDNSGGDGHGARDECADVRLAVPSTAIDLAVEWAESEAQTMLYAAKFYDSDQHTELLETMSRRQVGPGGFLPDTMGTSLLPQTTARKLFFLAHHQLYALRCATETQTALAHLVFGLLGLFVLVLQLPAADLGGAFNVRGILFVVFTLPLLANHRHVGGLKSQLTLFLHHRHCGLYSTALFLTTLVLCAAAECVVHAVALSIFCVLAIPQQAPLLLGIVAALGGLAHRLLLYVCVVLAPSHVGENSLALFYLSYATLTSGYLLNLTTFPRWIGWGSALRWGYAAAVKQQASGQHMVCDGPSNTSYCHTPSDYVALQGVVEDSLARSAWILVSMCACCVLVLGCGLSLLF